VGKAVKKMSSTLLRFPLEATVVHKASCKSRPFLPQLDPSSSRPTTPPSSPPSSPSSGPPSPTQSGQSSPGKDSTGKTSVESKYSSSKDSVIVDRKPAGSGKRGAGAPAAQSSLDAILTPIEETALDAASPTVVTVEKAAAAKIYLETFFNELLSQPSPRSLRLQYLEAQLYHDSKLSAAEKDQMRNDFFRRETEYLRELRVIKTESLLALAAPKGATTPCEKKYDVVKVLGKGSFGVVRLVKEKRVPGTKGGRRSVYAMKVIRKSAMLRSSQEGHLRAERDFLVASEGSQW